MQLKPRKSELTGHLDAFGVVNFLTLYKETQERKYLIFAQQLVQAVHDILGRTRDGANRLPGASDEHPLNGGLRIGKENESGDDGDGQYHHYLTKWMFALNRLGLATGDFHWNELAIALAKAIHPKFMFDRDTDRPRMVWKMSMDLSHPLVNIQGGFDSIDGYVTYRILEASAGRQVLDEEIKEYGKIVKAMLPYTPSTDSLDLGCTLWITHFEEEQWVAELREKCKELLPKQFETGRLRESTRRRLAFREYGLCLGIACAAPQVNQYREHLIQVWENDTSTGNFLKAINDVMRASAIIPGAFQSRYLDADMT